MGDRKYCQPSCATWLFQYLKRLGVSKEYPCEATCSVICQSSNNFMSVMYGSSTYLYLFAWATGLGKVLRGLNYSKAMRQLCWLILTSRMLLSYQVILQLLHSDTIKAGKWAMHVAKCRIRHVLILLNVNFILSIPINLLTLWMSRHQKINLDVCPPHVTPHQQSYSLRSLWGTGTWC